MELTYSELKKRDVINVTDGRCLGRIIDLRLSFPEGVLVGIIVPGRRVKGILRIFDKSELYIDESRIIRIGGDVILVDINCGEVCSPSIGANSHKKQNHQPPSPPCPPKPPCPPCPPPCPPSNCVQPCPPPCPPSNCVQPCPPNPCEQTCYPQKDSCKNIFTSQGVRIDTDDY